MQKGNSSSPRRMRSESQSQGQDAGSEGPRNSSKRQSRPSDSKAGASSKAQSRTRRELFEVETAVQDNLKETALATEELKNVKRALIPTTPMTDPGSACITFSREQSAELHGLLLSCQTSMANDPEKNKTQACSRTRGRKSHTRGCTRGRHRTQACQTCRRVGEKLAMPPPPAPAAPPGSPPEHPESLNATMKDVTQDTTLRMGQGQRRQQHQQPVKQQHQ